MFLQSWPADNNDHLQEQKLHHQQRAQLPWSSEQNAQHQSLHSSSSSPVSVSSVMVPRTYAPAQPAVVGSDAKPFAFQYNSQPPSHPHFDGPDSKLYSDNTLPQYGQAHSDDADVKAYPPAPTSNGQQWRLPQIQNHYDNIQFSGRNAYFADPSPRTNPITTPEQGQNNLATNYMPVTTYAASQFQYGAHSTHSSPTSPTHPAIYYGNSPVNSVQRSYSATQDFPSACAGRGYVPAGTYNSAPNRVRSSPTSPTSPYGPADGTNGMMDGDAPHLWSNHHFNGSAHGVPHTGAYDPAHSAPILQPPFSAATTMTSFLPPASVSHHPQARRYSFSSGIITSAPPPDLHHVSSTSSSPVSPVSSTSSSVMSPMYPPYMKSYHYKVPLTDRPFACDKCPQSFNRNHDLKRHKRIHLAVKPFPCPCCDKQFSRKDALKRHVLVKRCGQKSTSPNSNGGNGETEGVAAGNGAKLAHGQTRSVSSSSSSSSASTA
ncbi:hypothetical protein BC936DRAFT_147701 [Jimgerdemannia flammicorona]|uniref:C2H2-type domain-containing protein n=1 Tax=Jimgerdemannia flammicorona TaxID=994334 RepID=A0A433D4V2_9FUNG|nr:hypothetical protein BC936DRAFT_147701 [Jimgerdemannia flammicorona]